MTAPPMPAAPPALRRTELTAAVGAAIDVARRGAPAGRTAEGLRAPKRPSSSDVEDALQ
jgi:hypothetical protein